MNTYAAMATEQETVLSVCKQHRGKKIRPPFLTGGLLPFIISVVLILASGDSQKPLKKAETQLIFGEEVKITDEDIFTLLTEDKKQEKITLYRIVCPERTQPFGTVTKQHLSNLIFRKKVQVAIKDYLDGDV